MGTSKACGQAGNGRALGRSGGMRNPNLGTEGGAVSPYPVQDYADAPAMATMARFAPRRRATCAGQILSHVDRPRCIMEVAA